MNQENPLPYPEEFHIDTSEAAAPTEDQTRNRLLDLFGFRRLMTFYAQQTLKHQLELEEQTETQQRQQKKLMQAVVEVVDDLGRLVLEAEKHTAGTPKQKGFFSWFSKRPTTTEQQGPSTNAPQLEWLGAFRRLFNQAVNTLENSGIFHVPLQGADLKALAFEEQLVKPWVGVKNEPKDGQLIVKEVIRGLWLVKTDNRLMPIQRGEVLV